MAERALIMTVPCQLGHFDPVVRRSLRLPD
jgi:hypothetical protein